MTGDPDGQHPGRSGGAPSRGRILVVEDEAVVALEICDRLAVMGYAPIGPVTRGEDALATAARETPELVLLDVRLRGTMDGPETAARIRERLDVPIVFVTAHSDEDTLTRALRVAPDGYVVKPIDPRLLAVAVEVALRRHREHQARLLAERERWLADARCAAVLEGAHDGIIGLDRTLRVTVFNPGAERIFGYRAEEVVGRELDRLLPAGLAGAHRAKVEQFARETERGRPMGTRREVTGRRSSGETFPAEVTIGRAERDGDLLLTASVRDVTERHRMEARLVQAQKLEVVGRLAASVAHDFNNVLTALAGSAHVLRAEVPEALVPRVEELMAYVGRGSALTRSLLGLARTAPAEQRRHEVDALLHDAEPMLRHVAGERVSVRIERGAPGAQALVDGAGFEQLLMNLVANARDAMVGRGEVHVCTTVEVLSGCEHGAVALPPGRYVRIEVRDDGPGIPAELAEVVFEPFFTTKNDGTGLGLAAVRETARRSGGDAFVLPGPRGGTTVGVFLPVLPG